jgi:dTDP-4-dehydrorhamnose 3,5-epimerase
MVDQELFTPVPATVTPEGEALDELIDGVMVRRAVTHTDERGTLCEMFDPRWELSEHPLVYVYQITIRPGQVKGWVVHHQQDDRLFFSAGTAKAVLYDDREGSPTRGAINELFFDPHNRGLLIIPIGVIHAITNVGSDDVLMVNMPTRQYDHSAPDKQRLPRDTDAIPYRL